MEQEYQELQAVYSDTCTLTAADGSYIAVDISDGSITTNQYGLGNGTREIEMGAGGNINLDEVVVFFVRVKAYRDGLKDLLAKIDSEV